MMSDDDVELLFVCCTLLVVDLDVELFGVDLVVELDVDVLNLFDVNLFEVDANT